MACGVIANEQYFPCKNVHEKPKEYFRIDGKERLAINLQHGQIEAILHSHPYELKKSHSFLIDRYNPSWPSVADQFAGSDAVVVTAIATASQLSGL